MSQDPQASQASSATPVFVPGLCVPKNRRFVLIAAILASALGFIDGTVVAIALPAMRATLGADLFQAQWIHNAYMLTLSALILVGGAAGDRFGLVRVFSLGIALFVLSSVLCALAPSANFLILARAAQGVGAAIMVPGSLAIIARTYPREERGRAIGIWAASSALTTALGPIIGGLALTFGGDEMWRWIFAVNLPLGGLAIWLLWSRTDREAQRPDTPVDAFGAFWATAALFALAWGLTQLPTPDWRWVAAGLGLLAVFIAQEARTPHPMMPLSLFRSPVFSAANLMAFCLYSALSMMFFFMPMTFIAGWGQSEIDTAATFAPMAVFISLLSARAGALADRIGPRPLLVSGAIIVAGGYGLMGWLAPAQNFWGHMLPCMCLVGLGMSLVVAPLSTAIMGAVNEDQSGIASGINNAITRMAGLISVAAVGGLVAAHYLSAGGEASFGVVSDGANHSAAMDVAFRGLAYLSSGLALLASMVALGTGRRTAS